jgi:rSAM/selenodomain-associated transferase 1
VLGAVKTRLSPPLSPRQTLALYAAFLEDAAHAYGSSAEWLPVLAAEPDPDDPVLARIFAPPWRRESQAPGHLGVKLAAAFASEFARGASSVLAVGSDHPGLPRASVEAAFDAVATGWDAAMVPAQDGGYCAIALGPEADPEVVFRDVPWSTSRALVVTQSNLEAAGHRVRTLPASYDVDRLADLERLRLDLSRRDTGAPDFPAATARALRELGRDLRP